MTYQRRFDADIEVFRESASIANGYPAQDDLRGALDGNFQFSASFMSSTWDDAAAAAILERERLDLAEQGVDRRDYYARLEGDAEDEEQSEFENTEILSNLDVGIGTVIFALNAAGCLTSTGCSGHQLIPGRDHPHVAFHADFARATIVRNATIETGCGFGQGAEPGVLIVWSSSVRAMVDFGQALIARSPEFEALPGHRLTAPQPFNGGD
jgi:hypothetical protein